MAVTLSQPDSPSALLLCESFARLYTTIIALMAPSRLCATFTALVNFQDTRSHEVEPCVTMTLAR